MNTSFRILVPLALLVAGMPQARAADGGFKAGLEVRGSAELSKIGLPAYPGAQLQRDQGDDGPGATIGLWGGLVGFKLAVLKFNSPDSVDSVARFYREALARNGAVLDCSRPDPKPAVDDKQLHCGDDRPPPGGQLYKVGKPNRLQLVSVEPGPKGQGSRFVLLRMAAGAP